MRWQAAIRLVKYGVWDNPTVVVHKHCHSRDCDADITGGYTAKLCHKDSPCIARCGNIAAYLNSQSLTVWLMSGQVLCVMELSPLWLQIFYCYSY